MVEEDLTWTGLLGGEEKDHLSIHLLSIQCGVLSLVPSLPLQLSLLARLQVGRSLEMRL